MPDATTADYMVISRGRWDESLQPETIQEAIDRFYAWYEGHLVEGTMKPGQRLAPQTKLVTKSTIIDGPFSETKEIVGGYWFIVASSLEEAAEIAAGNPCLACGLTLEIRPIDPVKASAFAITCETPTRS